MRLKIAGAIAVLIVSLSCGADKSPRSADLVSRTSPVQVGEVAPDFTLEDQNLQEVTLSSARGQAPVVLVFYRGHW